MPAKLAEYRRKRDFTRTREPSGAARRRPAGRARTAKPSPKLSFVIHKHAARRLHYDLRLEWEGVLKSWAVPKGPNLDPSVKALAVQVEDHPLEYGGFEGAIPEGEYGAGEVIIWDRGRWTPLADPREGFKRGRLEFELHGEKLRGKWRLVRMRSGDANGKPNWLLMKSRDQHARPASDYQVVTERPESVVSGRHIEKRRPKSRATRASSVKRRAPSAPSTAAEAAPRGPAELPGARRAAMPQWVAPQLATLVDAAPDGDEWLHETKFDGYRLIACRRGESVRLLTRKAQNWTTRFAHIAKLVAELPVREVILDGEIVALNASGLSDFQALQNAMRTRTLARLFYFVFDVTYCDGFDLTATPLEQRKRLLGSILAPATEATFLRFSDHLRGRGPHILKRACQRGLEGIISKRADSRYESRRTRTWLKSKCTSGQEFVIGGYTDPQGARTGFGALLVGYHTNGDLRYCGRVGTGFDQRLLRSLTGTLQRLEQPKPPFADPPTGADVRGVHWVAPELVAQVNYASMTSDGILRHASFEGLRPDKDAAEVVREAPAHAPTKRKTPAPPKRKAPSPNRTAKGTVVAGVTLTNPDRILFPGLSLTKADLAAYYEHVADAMLPHLADRPLMLVRCPEGFGKPCFHQKHPPAGVRGAVPEALRRAEIREKRKAETALIADDLAGLISLVQISALEIHTWGSRVKHLEQPDRIVFDLDPGPGVAWSAVVEAALLVRERLESLGLTSFVKTTGGKGLHVVAPIRPSADWDQVKQFSRAVSAEMVSDAPEKYVGKMSKSLRPGRIYVDYLRNGRGATCVSVLSARAKPEAPVSMPLTWRQLPKVEDPREFTIQAVPTMLRRRTDPWKGYFEKPKPLSTSMLRKFDLA